MFSQSCVSGFHRISEGVESELLRSDGLPPPHLGDTFGHPRTPNDHPQIIHVTVSPRPTNYQISIFNRGHRLPPNRCHRFRHPRAQTTPHHSIIHTPKMIVYLAPNIFQFSRGSPPPTQSLPQIPSSTRTNNSAQLDHPPTANTSPPSSTRQISIF